ncbi:MAG: glycosyltransferase [Colwellia sp.]|jgi:glycosyltransferase involved in cell wall biosynthesis
MNKKVLHIFGGMNRGGAELRTLDTMQPLAEKGIELEYCALSGKKGVLDESIFAAGSKVHYCALGIFFPFKLFNLLRQNKFDTVHSHVALVSGVILLIAWLAGVKQRVAHFRSTQEVAERSLLRKFRNKVFHQLIDFFATDILGVCQAALVAFWRKDWQKDSRCRVIYNGLKTVDYQIKDPSFWQDYAIKPNMPVIVNIARMDPPKNHLFMVKLLAEYIMDFGNAYLVFVGKEDPQTKERIITLAQKHNCEELIIFAGEQSNIYPFIQNADTLLFPSLWEGLPGAVIEAASVGLPVVASDLPGVKEIAVQLPSVKYLSLRDNTQQWVKLLNQSITSGDQERKQSCQEFTQSQFNLNQCVEGIYAVYR